MKITREQLRNIVGEVLQEEKDYQSFFKAMLKKHGVSSPDEFKSDEEKKAFFNKIEDTWKGVSERLQSIKEDELTAKQQKIDLNKNGKIDGDDLSKLRAGAKTESELTAKQQKIDLNKNGKVDGDDLSKLRAGAKTEGEESTSLTKILSKEGETLVKSGAGKMYNITKVNEARTVSNPIKVDNDTMVQIVGDGRQFRELTAAIDRKTGKPIQKFGFDRGNEIADSKEELIAKLQKKYGKSVKFESVNEGKKVFKVNPGIGKAKYSISSHDGKKTHKDGSDFYDIEIFNNKVDLEKGIKKYTSNGFMKESVNEAVSDKKVDAKLIANKMRKNQSTKAFADKVEKMGKVSHKDLETILPDYVSGGLITNLFKESIKEGRYDADLDKIEAAVKGATSFMNVGSELKKAGIKYDFTTSMIPMYMIKVSGNTIAVVNKKYAAGAEREVKDIAIGLLN
jgi:hypothetical protein